jgi:DNA-binding SARP family transcriptional activator
LCKRLAATAGEPVPRDELIDLLWPNEDDPRPLPARLSVQLSTVRRLLGGGVIADRDSVRLDTRAVEVDLVELHDALRAGRDDDAAVLYRGEFLPEDAYADWAIAPRHRARNAMLGALLRLADRAAEPSTTIDHLQRALTIDPFAVQVHERLIRALLHGGRPGEAQRAHERYAASMGELGVVARPLPELPI